MAERTKVTAPATRPVPMKLFATWEVDRTPPNCIPRSLFALIILAFNRPRGSALGAPRRYGFDAKQRFYVSRDKYLCALFVLFIHLSCAFRFYFRALRQSLDRQMCHVHPRIAIQRRVSFSLYPSITSWQ